MALVAEPLGIATCELGEGPVWHENALWFVDIEGETLHRWKARTGKVTSFNAGDRIGFAVPTTSGGKWAVGLQRGLALWSPGNGDPQVFCNPESANVDNRFNDGKVDLEGRLFAGTMHLSAKPNQGALYRIDADLSVHRMLSDVTVSNGLAWEPSKERMYYVDSMTRRVDCFDWSRSDGELTNQRCIIEFSEDDGLPDGMCINSDGVLLVALWGSGRVAVVDPTLNKCIDVVEVPVPNVSCCCFGGENMDQLFITTARLGLDDRDLANSPLSGDVFVATPGGTGLKTELFKFDASSEHLPS